MDQNTNEEKKPVGAIISIIIIVFVLAFGAYYFLKQVPSVPEEKGSALIPTEIPADQTISALSTQGTSTELVDIKKDLDATNLSGLDAGLSNMAI